MSMICVLKMKRLTYVKILFSIDGMSLHNKIILVTVAILTFIAVFNFAYFLGAKEALSKIETPEAEIIYRTGGAVPINNSCDGKDCLFREEKNNQIIGFLTAEGYYQEANDSNKNCGSFVVTQANNDFLEEMMGAIDQGNTVNSQTSNDELILSLDLSDLTQEEMEKITDSTTNSQIKLNLVRTFEESDPAIECVSFVDIVGVADIN